MELLSLGRRPLEVVVQHGFRLLNSLAFHSFYDVAFFTKAGLRGFYLACCEIGVEVSLCRLPPVLSFVCGYAVIGGRVSCSRGVGAFL